jgi:acyl-coenzyme A synthetase/AMP-(fatty) acid ligase
VYGPLCLGATTTMFESTPMYPDHNRYWQMVERHRLTTLYTAPTAVRALMRYPIDGAKKCDRSSLRVLGSVGEPINPDVWKVRAIEHNAKTHAAAASIISSLWLKASPLLTLFLFDCAYF